MKKQILTLSMCLALTATAALATGTTKVSTSPVKTVAATTTITPEKPCIAPQKLSKQQFEDKMAQHREKLYSDLGLSEAQKTKAEALDKKNKEGIKPLFDKVRTEKMKYNDLKTKKASEAELIKQKAEVKKAKKEVKKYMEKSRKDFEAILTKEQKAKFKAIREERKAKMKEFKKEHKPGFGSTPPGGPQGPCPCGIPHSPEQKCPCKK